MTEQLRLQAAFSAAFGLDDGLIARCRAAVSAGGDVDGFEHTRTALEELGHGGHRDGLAVPAVAAAEDLRRIVLRAANLDPGADTTWRVPVAAATGGRLGPVGALAGDERARAGWLDLLERWLLDRFPEQRRSVDIGVLTRLGARGELAQLRLRALADGPGGLFPHPTMAIFYGDEAFRASVADAWCTLDDPPTSVTWELRSGDIAVDHVGGASAGGAFAVALRHLKNAEDHRVSRVVGVRSRTAVSARVRPDGLLTPVHGRDEKLAAAVAGDVGLVVLAASEPGAVRQTDGALKVALAADVEQAVAYTRGRVSRLSLAISIVLLAAVLMASILAIENRAGSRRDRRERLSRVADELLSQAASTGRDNLPLQQKLLLAASSVAREARNGKLSEEAVSRSSATAPGILKRLGVDLAASPDGMLSVYNGHSVIAWGESGHLAQFDASTGTSQGTYIRPPGVDTLTQAIPTASAALPGTALAAFVFQNQLKIKADHRATLVILSTAGSLQAIGTAPNFTTAPTNAVGYAPSGTRLITVSGPDLTVWKTESAEPSAMYTCRWRPDAVTSGAVQVVTLPGGRPGLILDRGQIVRLHRWDPGLRRPCLGRVSAGPLPAVGAQGLFGRRLAFGEDANGRPVQFGVREDGRLDARPLGGLNVVRSLKARAVAVGTPQAGLLPIQGGTDGKPTLVLDRASGTRLAQTASYQDHSLPALADYASAFATQRRVVDQLSVDSETYPSGAIDFAVGRQVLDRVAMSGRVVALAYAQSVAVFGLHDRSLDRVLTWPDGMRPAGGDGTFDDTFSVSGSGRYAAGLVYGDKAPRQLALLDVRNHAVVDVRGLLRKYSTLAPLDISFERDGDRLYVEYLNGLLLRLTPSKTGWKCDAVLRGKVTQQAYSLHLSSSAAFRIEADAGRARVAEYDFSGRLSHAWPLATTHESFGLSQDATEAQLAVMSDSRAALVLDSGSALILGPHGTVGKPIPLGDGPVLSTAQVSSHELMLAVRTGAVTLDLDSAVTQDSTQTYGLLSPVAASPSFDILAGGSALTAQSVVVGLRRDQKTAALCDSAGGDLTRAAWRRFVPSGVPYRPICESFRTQARAIESLAVRSKRLIEPAGLITPALDQASDAKTACAKQTNQLGSARAANGTLVICLGGAPIWVATMSDLRVSTGGTRSRPLLLVNGVDPAISEDSTRLSELIDASGNVVEEYTSHGGTAALIGNRVAETERAGDLLFATTYKPAPNGLDWITQKQTPIGTARLPSPG